MPVAPFADAIARLPASAHRGGLLYVAGARDTARASWHAACERRTDHEARALLIVTETSIERTAAHLDAMARAVHPPSAAALALAAVVAAHTPGCDAVSNTLHNHPSVTSSSTALGIARDVVAATRAELPVPDALVVHVAEDEDNELLLPLVLRRTAAPQRAVDALRDAAESTIDEDRARRLRELAVFAELFRVGRPARALQHARALLDASNPSLPALWAAWFAAWESDELAQLVPVLRRRAFAAPQPLRDHLNAAIADAGLYVAVDGADEALVRVTDAAWQSRIRDRRARPERHRAISGAFASVVDATDRLETTDVLAQVDEGRDHLLHGRWTEATACFADAAERSVRPADRARLRRLAASAAALTADHDLFAGLVLQALGDDPRARETWDMVLRACDRRDDIGLLVEACEDHGRPAHPEATRRLRAMVRAHPGHASRAVDVFARALAAGLPEQQDPLDVADDADALSVAIALPHYGISILAELAAHAASPVRGTTRDAIDAVADIGLRALAQPGLRGVWDLCERTPSGPRRGWLLGRLVAAIPPSRELLARLTDQADAGDLDARWALALAHERQQDRAASAQHASAVVEARPRHAGARRLLAQHARDEARWDDAISHLEIAARNTPSPDIRADLYREVGDLWVDHFDHPRAALENYLVAFVCVSDDPATLARLDTTYRRLERTKELIGTLTVAINHARANPHTRLDVVEAGISRARLEVEVLGDRVRAAHTLRELALERPEDDHVVDLFVQLAAGQLGDDEIRHVVARHLDALPESRRRGRRGADHLGRWSSQTRSK